jgi:hypothetical protein
VQRLRDEVANDPGVASRRQQKARERAAREREERIRKALERMPEMEGKKKADAKEKARVSTTDAEATVMKMAEGGFRPAYNVQFSTDTNAQVIVGVEVATCGSAQGQMAPMVEQIHERYEQYPKDVLVDGGFVEHDDIDTLSAPEQGCTVYGPVPKPQDTGKDRYAPRATDSAAVAAWRQRMRVPKRNRSTRTPCGDGGVRERPGAESGAASAAGAWCGQGEGNRAVVCDRSQPAAGGESACGAGGTGLGERGERAGQALRSQLVGVLPMVSVGGSESAVEARGLTFSPATGVVCSKSRQHSRSFRRGRKN